MWIFFCLTLLVVIQLDGISAQIRYSIQEEVKLGTPVGNVAKDLGLDLGRLVERNLRVVSGTKQDLFKVNARDGVLLVNQRVDREELCAQTAPCVANLKAVVENPLEMHQVIVEIIDVNDNSPKFPRRKLHIGGTGVRRGGISISNGRSPRLGCWFEFLTVI